VADAVEKAYIFKAQVQEKIQKLIQEFAAGTISREQFHVIYERYTGQLAIADMAVMSSMPETVMGLAQSGPSTIAVKEAYTGRAVGMLIYNNRSGMLLETLGSVDVPPEKLAPILNDFTMMMERGKKIEREIRKLSPRQWLLFAAGRYTTIVTLFRNEPSELQGREIERLHHDFEEANRPFFEGSGVVDAGKLAYPFLVFVQRRVKGEE
jgi:hypothetical protein